MTPYLDGIVGKLLSLLQVILAFDHGAFILCSINMNLFGNFVCFLIDWKPNGARRCFNCFSISCRFFSGTRGNIFEGFRASILAQSFAILLFQEHFQKYYDAVMPYLKSILMNATDKSNRMLRAKSMECISLVGMAVGKQKFKDDAKQVIIC